MRKTKVCFIFPRTRYISGDPPLGLGYLSAYLKKHCKADIRVIDTTFRRSLEHIYPEIKDYSPDILGIYADSIMANDALSIAKWAKANSIYTVVGGPQATILPDNFIEYADAVVRGEGEKTLAGIINNFGSGDLSNIKGIVWKKDNQRVRNPDNIDFLNLDDIPFPDRELFPIDRYLYHWHYLDSLGAHNKGTTMISSRGCNFSCSYCQPTLRQVFGAKLRFRSPENVIAEIKLLKERFNIDGVFFHDDTLTVDHSWLHRFCSVLQDAKIEIFWGCNSRIDTVNKQVLKMMYSAGLRNIHFGIESASQRIIDQIYNKRIKIDQAREVVDIARTTGIYTMGFFMLGAPTETEQEINRTIRFARGLNLQEASFSLTTPLAGTYLYDNLLKNKNYELNAPLNTSNYYSRYLLKGEISPKRMKFLQYKALIYFYSHPLRLKYILTHLFSIKGIKKLINKFRRFS